LGTWVQVYEPPDGTQPPPLEAGRSMDSPPAAGSSTVAVASPSRSQVPAAQAPFGASVNVVGMRSVHSGAG
jgi:hypothetical protein